VPLDRALRASLVRCERLFSQREDPRDVLVMALRHAETGAKRLQDLPAGSLVGTSSLRRQALVRRLRPDVRCETVRGNLQTRVRKLDEPEAFDDGETEAPRYDALVLAAAGVARLGWGERVSQVLGPDVDGDGMWAGGAAPGGEGEAHRGFLWGVGQGALAVEVRRADADVAAMVRAAVEGRPAALACVAERAMLRGLLGGCQVPIAVCSSVKAGAGGGSDAGASSAPSGHPSSLSMRGLVMDLSGTTSVEREQGEDLGGSGGDGAAVQAAGNAAWARVRARGAVSRPAEEAAAGEAAAGEADEGVYADSGCHMFAPSDAALRRATAAGKALAASLVAAGASAILGDPTAPPRPITYGNA